MNKSYAEFTRNSSLMENHVEIIHCKLLQDESKLINMFIENCQNKGSAADATTKFKVVTYKGLVQNQ